MDQYNIFPEYLTMEYDQFKETVLSYYSEGTKEDKENLLNFITSTREEVIGNVIIYESMIDYISIAFMGMVSFSDSFSSKIDGDLPEWEEVYESVSLHPDIKDSFDELKNYSSETLVKVLVMIYVFENNEFKLGEL